MFHLMRKIFAAIHFAPARGQDREKISWHSRECQDGCQKEVAALRAAHSRKNAEAARNASLREKASRFRQTRRPEDEIQARMLEAQMKGLCTVAESEDHLDKEVGWAIDKWREKDQEFFEEQVAHQGQLVTTSFMEVDAKYYLSVPGGHKGATYSEPTQGGVNKEERRIILYHGRVYLAFLFYKGRHEVTGQIKERPLFTRYGKLTGKVAFDKVVLTTGYEPPVVRWITDDPSQFKKDELQAASAALQGSKG